MPIGLFHILENQLACALAAPDPVAPPPVAPVPAASEAHLLLDWRNAVWKFEERYAKRADDVKLEVKFWEIGRAARRRV